MVSEKMLRKYGSEEGYYRELARQRTRGYKDKRNARCKKKRLRDKYRALILEELDCEKRIPELKKEQKKILEELRK